jgi:hypothetical protein
MSKGYTDAPEKGDASDLLQMAVWLLSLGYDFIWVLRETCEAGQGHPGGSSQKIPVGIKDL